MKVEKAKANEARKNQKFVKELREKAAREG